MIVEAIVITALLGIALVPLAAAVYGLRINPRRTTVTLITLWIGFSLIVVGLALTRSYQPLNNDTITNRPLAIAADNYVGSQTCRSCHPHNHATWYNSYHRTMTQVAGPKSVIGDFNNVKLKDGGITLRLGRDQHNFFVNIKAPHQQRRGDFITIQRPIVLTTGSHNMQAYWFAMRDDSRVLASLPFVYLKKERRWIPAHTSFLTHRTMEGYKPGEWNRTCINCHATHGRYRPGKTNAKGDINLAWVDTQVAEFGISCEACHGPGQTHVRAHRNPIHRYRHHVTDEADPSIVNPAKLSHKRSSEVCGQCHSVWEAFTEAYGDLQQNGFDYRPGENLHASRVQLIVRGHPDSVPAKERDNFAKKPNFFDNRFWSDGMVRISGREYNGLIESPCFQHGNMSCLSCHRMHQATSDQRPPSEWANDQLKAGFTDNRACLQCHPQFSSPRQLTRHTHHPADSVGSRCYNCHMPYTTYGLLKAIRSHQVDSPTVQASLQTGRPNACNQCHLDKTMAWTADYLSQWHGTPKPKLPKDEEEIAASVLWLLRGDAGQRALMAWSYGWSDAHRAAGTGWQAPYLGQLLADPYPAVRFIAARSLRRFPGYQKLDYDFVAPRDEWKNAPEQVYHHWTKSATLSPPNAAVLLDKQGHLQKAVFDRLLKVRDNRKIDLNE